MKNSFPSELPDPSRRIVGMDTILGKPCVVSEFNGAIRVWTWENIQLKTETVVNADGLKVNVTAVSLDEHYVIKPDEFQIPKNAKVTTQ